MSPLTSYLKLKQYQWEVTLGLYMLETWEKVAFNTMILFFLLLSLYTLSSFLPSTAQSFLTKANDYILGAGANAVAGKEF